MRIFILISTMISIGSVYCFGQEFPPKTLEQFNFSSIESIVSKDQKQILLRKIVFSDYLLPPSDLENILTDEFKNYHFLDFNADGKLDIIYDGRNPIGMETNNIVFFLSQEDSIRPVIKLNGDFTKIIIKDNHLQSFQLIKTPCCSDYLYKIEDYSFQDSDSCFITDESHIKSGYRQVNKPEFCVALTSQYMYSKMTEFPNKINAQGFFTLSKRAILNPKPRAFPNSNFKENRKSSYGAIKKTIMSSQKGIICQVLAEKSDEYNNAYCFILLKIKKNHRINQTHNYYCWVKKVYLDKYTAK